MKLMCNRATHMCVTPRKCYRAARCQLYMSTRRAYAILAIAFVVALCIGFIGDAMR